MDPVKSSIKVYGGVNLLRVKIDTAVTNNMTLARNNYGKYKSNFVIESDYNSGKVYASYFVPGLLEGVKSMAFYKRTPSQKYYDLVTDDEVAMFVMDYNIRNHEYYHYMVAITKFNHLTKKDEVTIYENRVNDTGEELVQYEGHIQYLKAFWDAWSICNIELSATNENTYIKVGDIWRLKYNITEENLNLNFNITVWDTLSRYSKISKGLKDFVSSTFTGLLGDIEQYKSYKNEADIVKTLYDSLEAYTKVCGYTEKLYGWDNPYSTEMDKLKAWLEFCADGKLKLLKDLKGNAWVVQIIGNPSNNIDIKSNILETLISFEWLEVMDISKISIIRARPIEDDKDYSEISFSD